MLYVLLSFFQLMAFLIHLDVNRTEIHLYKETFDSFLNFQGASTIEKWVSKHVKEIHLSVI